MSYETLIVEKDAGIGVITLNRPDKMNAMNPKMFAELPQALADMASDQSVRVVVLTASGRGFCAGADLSEGIITRSTGETSRGQAAGIIAEMKELHKIVLGIREMGKPVVGAINGAAVGAGFALALACDMRVVSDKARFGMAFAGVGLVPDFGGSYFLPRIVGTAKACELIFTTDTFDAAEAEKLGVANKVVPAEDLMAAAMSFARRFVEGPPIAISLAKDMIYKEQGMDLAAALDYEAAMQAIAMQTADHVEGVKAFFEKRKPAFQGR